ncbi:hypothetical protein EXIGLDRAFT_838835 [Exidia glandulosa HHB12029]|uniref:Uncharacterized protein n=1 Tax=Exidia glandulosa HHB12029 TaxID=1314781 RepID=A0A165FGY9_EXIGL|nr:hypothetical protein EXIGLDRAFT_838835 [Exidia glandulosa HHB12029]
MLFTKASSYLPTAVQRRIHATHATSPVTDQVMGLLASHNSLLQRPKIRALVKQFRAEELALNVPHATTALERRRRTRRRPLTRDAFATQTRRFDAALAQEAAKRDEARAQDYGELKRDYAELKKKDEARAQEYAELKKKDERREQYEAATAHVAAAVTLKAELFMLGMTHALYQAARNKSFEKMAKGLAKFLGRQVTAPLTPLQILRLVSAATQIDLQATEAGKNIFTKVRNLVPKDQHGVKNVLGIRGMEASAGGSPVHEISLDGGLVVLERVGELQKSYTTVMPFALRKDWKLARRIAMELFGPDLGAFRQSLSQEDKKLILYNSTSVTPAP